MLHSEFTTLTGIQVSAEEFEAINAVYMNADEDVDKQTFCKMWCKLNTKRIKAYKAEQKRKEQEYEIKERMLAIKNKLNHMDNWTVNAVDILSVKEQKLLLDNDINLKEWSYRWNAFVFSSSCSVALDITDKYFAA